MSSITESVHNGHIMKAFDGHLKNNHSLKTCSGENGLIPSCQCQTDKVSVKDNLPQSVSEGKIDLGSCGCTMNINSMTSGGIVQKNSARDSGVDVANLEARVEQNCDSLTSEESQNAFSDDTTGVSHTCENDSKLAQNSDTAPFSIEADDDDGKVFMRNTRRSLHRKEHTDTAVISNIFQFLQTNEEISEEPFNGQVKNLSEIGERQARVLVTKSEPLAEDEVKRSPVSDVSSNQNAVHTPKSCNDKGSELNGAENVSSGTVLKQSAGISSSQNAGGKGDGVPKNCALDAVAETEVRLRRSRLSKQDSTEEACTDDSSDEDVGVYAESFRRSNWIRIDDDGNIELTMGSADKLRESSASQGSEATLVGDTADDVTDSPDVTSPKPDEVFPESFPSPPVFKYHKRSESTSTTLSEREFKKEFVTRRKCLIQRQNSSKEYHRFSARVYDDEKQVVLQKQLEDNDYGLHIFDSQPAFITQVDPGSPAELAGVQEGQILISINGTSVLTATHDDIVRVMAASPETVRLAVATSDFQPSRDLQALVMEGYMQKLSEGLMRLWKKRYFILRQDSCLYYYKHKDEMDPLGAIPLAGYTFSRHLDCGRDYSFKADKYGAKTYYFVVDSRDEMTEWVGALTDAAARSKKRKESFVSVSSHNVGLPALEVRRPECTGYLLKVGQRHRSWRRRYCVLKDACVYYYKNMHSLSALGVAHLHGYKVDPWMAVGKKHGFGLLPPDPTLRTFQFSAENETDRQRWVDAMIRSIQRWVQIDNDC